MKQITKIIIPIITIVISFVFCGKNSTDSEDKSQLLSFANYQLSDACMDVFTDQIWLTSANFGAGIQTYFQNHIPDSSFRAAHDSLFGRAVAVDGNDHGYIYGFNIGNDSSALAVCDYGYFPQESKECWGICRFPYPLEDIVISGRDYAYVTHGENGVSIINIANSLNPQLIATIDTPGQAHSLSTQYNNYIYVADGTAGIQIYDVSSPGAPILVNSIDTPGEAYAIEIDLGYSDVQKAYVADGSAGILLIDSLLTTPVIAANIETPGFAEDITINYDLHFPSMKQAALVPDITPILNWLGLSIINNPSPTFDRGIIMVADGPAGFHAIWFKYDMPIEIVASYPTEGYAKHVSRLFGHNGNALYALADGSTKLQVVEIVRPDSHYE